MLASFYVSWLESNNDNYVSDNSLIPLNEASAHIVIGDQKEKNTAEGLELETSVARWAFQCMSHSSFMVLRTRIRISLLVMIAYCWKEVLISNPDSVIFSFLLSCVQKYYMGFNITVCKWIHNNNIIPQYPIHLSLCSDKGRVNKWQTQYLHTPTKIRLQKHHAKAPRAR